MTAHPTLLDLVDRSDEPSIRDHLADCAICGARALMLAGRDGEVLPGFDDARRALADTRRLASMSIGHTWDTDPLREDVAPPPDLESGRVLDRYVVRDRIGMGAMGALYRVEHVQLGSRHALKVLHQTSPSVRGRLIREGQAQSRLQHANVVPVTDVVDVDGSPGLIMELVDGPSLSAWLDAHGPPPLPIVARLGEQIIRAVAAAHAAGIVHRDLKPRNVLIAETDEGPTAKVCDFGLALWRAEGEEGRAGPLGTPGYMAPEQIRDASRVDARSDIFSLGAVLYELATGRRAFEAPDLLEVWSRIGEGRYTAPEVHRPDLPEPMCDTIARALEVDPDDRFPDCQALLASWRGGRMLTEEIPRPVPPIPVPPVAAPPVPRRVPYAPAVAFVLGIVALGALGLVALSRPAPPPAPVVVGTDRADRRLTAIPSDFQIFAVALSPDDSELLFTDGRGLWHQSLKTGEARLRIEGGPFHSVDWLPDGSGALVSGVHDGHKATLLFDGETGQVSELFPRAGGYQRVSPDGERVAWADDDAILVSALDGTGERAVRPLGDGQHASALAWSPDGAFLATVVQGRSAGKPRLERIRVEDGAVSVLLEEQRLVALGLSALEWVGPDRLLFAVTDGYESPAALYALDDASTVPDAEGRQLLRTWDGYAMIRIRAGGDGLIASRGTAVKDVWLLDPADPDAYTLLTPEDWADRPIGWTDEGVLLMSDRGAGGLFALRPDAPTEARPVFHPPGFPLSAFGVDGGIVAGKLFRPERDDGTRAEPVFRIERYDGGEARTLVDLPVLEPLGSSSPAHALRCTHTGRCLVSVPEQGTLQFRWVDPGDGQLSDPVASTPIGGRTVTWTLSPDASHVVALLGDPAVRVDIDLATGEAVESASGLDIPLSLVWLPSGDVIASGLAHASQRPYQVGRLGPDGSVEVLRSSMNDNFHTLLASPDGTQVAVGVYSFGTDVWQLAGVE
ncbi:MAG: protein kinase [Alphaproteobacteria bacterium]|nr:protein kinase [Alphaproteobacteria bacterium]